MFAILVKKTQQIGGRVSELARKLLEAECEETGESQGDVLERCLIQCLKSKPEGLKLIKDYASKDPTMAAIVSALIGPSSAGKGNH